ncbi:MAG: sodium:proton antiporter [Sedimentisphaerales bacterium]|nr:sodium:proton antiporter [Sedimentisphaerales bacterium]
MALLILLVLTSGTAVLYAQTTTVDPQSIQNSSRTIESIYVAIPFAILILAHALLPALPWTRKVYNQFGTRLLLTTVVIVSTLGFYWWRSDSKVESSPISYLRIMDIPAFLSFIIILGSLYIIAGNIQLRFNLKPTPWANLLLLTLGVLLAGFIGNIPAAIVMIFPLLKLNLQRKYIRHTIIFFIIAVANTGGALLPVGDAALLYRYVHTTSLPVLVQQIWPFWLAVNIALLVIYLIVDSLFWRLEKDRLTVQNVLDQQIAPVPTGRHNFLWLLLAIVIIVLKNANFGKVLNLNIAPVPAYLFDVLLLLLAALSLLTTPKDIRRENLFTKGVLLEAAVFYLGLFITVIPAMEALRSLFSPERLDAGWRIFWVAGAASSMFDNAAIMAALGQALDSTETEHATNVQSILAMAVIFFGALTYIGNGANFMIKSLAERAGIRMPGFFSYCFWSALILLPMLVALTIVQRLIFGLWGA